MTEEQDKKKFNHNEIVKMLVEDYLYNRYGISIEELDSFYGLKVCKFLTRIREYDMAFADAFGSQTVKYVTYEMNNQAMYNFDTLNFEPGDVVIDIGANISAHLEMMIQDLHHWKQWKNTK